MENRQAVALDQCLLWINQGKTIDYCLEQYSQLRVDLEPLIKIAISIREAPKITPSSEFVETSKAHLISNIRTKSIRTKPKEINMKAIETNRSVGMWRRYLDLISIKKLAVPVALLMVLAIVSGLFLTNTFHFSSPASGLTSNCTLSILSGSVDIQKKQTGSWLSGQNGVTLSTGDAIRTSADSQVLLTFFEGSTLRIGPASEIAIQQVSQSENKQTTIILNQMLGTTWSRVVHMADPG